MPLNKLMSKNAKLLKQLVSAKLNHEDDYKDLFEGNVTSKYIKSQKGASHEYRDAHKMFKHMIKLSELERYVILEASILQSELYSGLITKSELKADLDYLEKEILLQG